MLPKPFTAKRSFLKELKDVFWYRHVGGCISSFWSLGRKIGGMVLSNEDYETLLLLQPYTSSNTDMLHFNLQTIQPCSISLNLSTVPTMHLRKSLNCNKTISLVYSDILNDTVLGFFHG